MMVRNLDPLNGIRNGMRLIFGGFDKNVIHAEITIVMFSRKQVFIPRIKLSPPDNEGYPLKLFENNFQYLYAAMTINKAQGKTIPNV